MRRKKVRRIVLGRGQVMTGKFTAFLVGSDIPIQRGRNWPDATLVVELPARPKRRKKP